VRRVDGMAGFSGAWVALTRQQQGACRCTTSAGSSERTHGAHREPDRAGLMRCRVSDNLMSRAAPWRPAILSSPVGSAASRMGGYGGWGAAHQWREKRSRILQWVVVMSKRVSGKDLPDRILARTSPGKVSQVSSTSAPTLPCAAQGRRPRQAAVPVRPRAAGERATGPIVQPPPTGRYSRPVEARPTRSTCAWLAADSQAIRASEAGVALPLSSRPTK